MYLNLFKTDINEAAILYYTSGSSGNPKGVPISQKCFGRGLALLYIGWGSMRTNASGAQHTQDDLKPVHVFYSGLGARAHLS